MGFKIKRPKINVGGVVRTLAPVTKVAKVVLAPNILALKAVRSGLENNPMVQTAAVGAATTFLGPAGGIAAKMAIDKFATQADVFPGVPPDMTIYAPQPSVDQLQATQPAARPAAPAHKGGFIEWLKSLFA